jgi:hypothetical protein
MTSYNLDFLAYARLMMPVSEDGARITGIFGALIMSSGGDGFWRNFRDLHVEVPLESLGLRTDGSPT